MNVSIALLIHSTSALEGDDVVNLTSWPPLFVGTSRCPLHSRLGVPRRRYGLARKISLSLGIEPGTAHPVDCSYAYYVLFTVGHPSCVINYRYIYF